MLLTRFAALGLFSLTLFAQDFHWNGRLNSGQTIEIRGVNGAIHAETANGAEVEVSATKSSHRNDTGTVRVEAIPHAGGVVICAVYPDVDGKPNECKAGGGRMNTHNNDVKVEFVVKVPVGVKLSAHTVNGGIKVTDLRSEVDANTVNGSVHISTSEAGQAKSVNGSITAVVGRMDAGHSLKFETVNGAINVQLPSSLNAEVHASTVNGGITTDFPLTVSGKLGPRNVSGRIGSGGADLKLSTVNGAIHLKKS